MLRPRRRLAEQSLEARHFGLRGGEIAHVGRQLLGGQLGAGCLRAEGRVSEALREAIDRLPRSEQLETKLAFVERALGGLAGAIQFLFELVEEGHD